MGELPTVPQPTSCRRSFRSGWGQAPLGAQILGAQPEAADKGATPKIGKNQNQVDPKSGCPKPLNTRIKDVKMSVILKSKTHAQTVSVNTHK